MFCDEWIVLFYIYAPDYAHYRPQIGFNGAADYAFESGKMPLIIRGAAPDYAWQSAKLLMYHGCESEGAPLFMRRQ